jgi:hypothetical protein
MPSRVEGAAFPEGPEAAGVIAIGHYRRRSAEWLPAKRIHGVGASSKDGSPWGFRAISGGDLAAGQFEMND